MAAPFKPESYQALEQYFDNCISSDWTEKLQPWLQVGNELQLYNCSVVFDWGIKAIVALVLKRVHGQIVLSMHDHTGSTLKELSIEPNAVVDDSISYLQTLARDTDATSDELGAVIILDSLALKLSKRS